MAAPSRGRLVLEAWAQSLRASGTAWPAPEFVRALLALPRRFVAPALRAQMLHHLPLAEQVAWATALLPADPAAPHEAEWVQLLCHWGVPLHEPQLLRPLLSVLAAALAQPRTSANARQFSGLGRLLQWLHLSGIDARLYPEVQAALGAVVPVRPPNAWPLRHLLRGLALRYNLLRACEANAE